MRSADLLALGPLIIKFFRGRWCSYCTTELEAWRDQYEQLRERGVLMVAVSPQTVRQNDFMVTQHGLPFPLLSDPGCALAEQFGLAYSVPEYHRASYVIGRDGRVLFAEAHADFRVRPEPEEALEAALGESGK
jgi:peroxiredoxin